MDETGRLGLDISWLHWKFKRIDIRLQRLSWQEVCLCGISDNNPIFYYNTPNLCPSLFPWTPPTQSVQQPEGSYLYQILWLCHIPTLRYQWGKIAITDNHLKAKHKFICDIYSEAKLHHYRGLQKWPTFSVQYLSSIYLHKTQVTQPQKPVSGSGCSWQSL